MLSVFPLPPSYRKTFFSITTNAQTQSCCILNDADYSRDGILFEIFPYVLNSFSIKLIRPSVSLLPVYSESFFDWNDLSSFSVYELYPLANIPPTTVA